MRYNLLELTQSILSSMDSDEVNSINDTVESSQVVQIIKTVYDDIQSRADLLTQKTLFTLNASGDGSKPTLMFKPDSINNIDWIRYNIAAVDADGPEWADMQYMPQDSFIMMTQGFNVGEPNVGSMSQAQNAFNFMINYMKDRPPKYYTTFDDGVLIFDAYDQEVDATLQTSKTLGFGELSNVFIEQDGWVPNLQPQHFSLLLSEAKALAWTELKQVAHPKAELTARRNWRHISRTKQTIPSGQFGSGAHPFEQLQNFGRK